MNLSELLKKYYKAYGPPKPMNAGAPNLEWPHFFLHRKFLGEQDLAILFNTKRCRYQCRFCALPFKASRKWVDGELVIQQFANVIGEVKHGIGVFERLTVANEGSVLDQDTFPSEALHDIVTSVKVLPNIRKVVLESRLEFVSEPVLERLSEGSGKRLDILTGFETLDETIRDEVLGKREPLAAFTSGLDRLGRVGTDLTTYILFKPSPFMSDTEAMEEAERSIDYVAEQCDKRGIPLIIRLNPMYVARGTPWAAAACAHADYQPPRLSDVIALAERKIAQGVRIYLGLTSEGLSEPKDTYRGREDFSSELLKKGILLNLANYAAKAGKGVSIQ
jgi:radical SAM enzyme (TIGR01210 family)